MIVAALLQAALELAGTVLGPGGKPLPGALVEAGRVSARCDGKGRFRLRLASGEPVPVRISAPGMEPLERTGTPGQPLWAVLEPAVREATVEVVEGSGYSSEEGSTSTLSRLEVYTTPGAAADVMQAAKGLPGVSNTSEGAELYVRGGRPEEVGIWLNGGHLQHPFHHPNTQGGIFSAVDTALVTKVDFVPGAFSARYGDALSAVMDISTEQTVAAPTRTLLITIPTQGLALDQPLGEGLLRASTRRSNTSLLDKWYGLAPTFEDAPLSNDAQVDWQQPLLGGRFSATALYSRDHLATTVTIANLKDVYSNHSETRFGSLLWKGTVLDRAGLLLQLSQDSSAIVWNFNRWGLTQDQRTVSARAELALPLGEGRSLELGGDSDRTRLDPTGAVPLDLNNWNPDSAGRTFSYGFPARRSGAYLTLRTLFGPRWGLSLGGRQDHYGLQRETTHDLRATLSCLVREGVTLRLAGGSFHQAPPLNQADPHAGNPDLKVMRANHLLAALDAAWTGGAAWNLRLEVYRKDYDHLVVLDPATFYDSSGRGYAQGADLLLKAAVPGWRGWIGYGYLDTRRKEDLQYVQGPVPTSVPHNLTVFSAHTLAPGWELAATFRYASGAPVTPVLGATADPNGGWDPVLGPAYGDRLPAYHRADLRLTRQTSWLGARWASFGEVMNLLGRHNAAAYSYSADYSQRSIQESYFSRRMLVVGTSVQW